VVQQVVEWVVVEVVDLLVVQQVVEWVVVEVVDLLVVQQVVELVQEVVERVYQVFLFLLPLHRNKLLFQ
jgi:hypothetical protein